jgi:hypothetical protein
MAIPALTVCLCTGCQHGQPDSVDTPVTASLQATGASGAVDQMDFFDALERRPRVTYDELLAGVLMAAGLRTDGGYNDRLATARRAGIVGTDVPESGNMNATAGDLAKVMLRAQGVRIRPGLSGEEAVAIATRRSLLPESLKADSPLTGPITVAALSAAGQPTGGRVRAIPSTNTTTPSTPQRAGVGSEP